MKLIMLLLLGLGIQLSYAQNTCATALPIGAGITTVPGIDGTNIPTACSNSGDALAEWYVYVPTQNYSVTVTSDLIQNICKDTHFMVYTGTCAGLTCYANDDDGGVIQCNVGNPNSYLSIDTFDVTAGTTYYIVWDNRWGQTAGFDFQLIESPIVPSPCATATPVTAGVTTVTAVDGVNLNTTCSSITLQAEWYAYTPTQNFRVTVSSDLPQNICKDTNFSVYTGSCSGTLNCLTSDDNSGIIECNVGNTNSFLSKKTFDVNAGTTYYIVWDSKWSAAGFDFQITEVPIVIPITYNIQSIPTVNSAYNMCVVDMNGDGLDDLAGVSGNNLRVHYQGAGGTFTYTDFPIAGTSNMPGWSMAAGDYNADGYTDLLLGSTNGLSFWESNATGTAYTSITPGQFIFCQRTNFSDLNNDGHLDAFSCHDVAPNCYYLNDGNGHLSSFYQVGVTAGSMSLGSVGGNYATIFCDYDNDGDSDMFVSKCSGLPCELHRNDGNGVFTDISAVAGINIVPDSWSSAVGDFDNDGDMDIIVGANGSYPTVVYRNNLDLSNSTEEPFTDITVGSGFDLNSNSARDWITYDFDNDGNLDVLSSGNRIMFGKGDNTFELVNYPSMGVGAVGDLNNDGFLDIQMPSSGAIRYAVPNANKWIKIVPKGTTSNSQGIGARVEIYGSFGKRIRDIRSGEGFGYMSTLNAHFGIGTGTIEKIIIKWPSGETDVIMNPPVNQTIEVIEGSSPLKTDEMVSQAFSIYPNPASDALYFTFNSSIQAKSAQVFDLNGREVLNTTIANDTISVKKLASGTYIVLVKDLSGRQYTQKFIKK
ncbi:FG-GAP-like repeat-containing protein [Flavobacterium sp.]|uniref:FG-GAP-like repeat-containing protein n=1 Tax=Flavobacterium sp. TaxID=239 RepID=UPI0039E61910